MPQARRLPPQERERLILHEATRYFAEKGLAAGTVELAKRLGITQPLLYKYFRTKDALIERVFETLFRGHWDPRWETLLNDASVPIDLRLKRFYRDYATVVLTYEHVRLFLFSGLAGRPFNVRYYDIVTQRIFVPIARGLRASFAVTPYARRRAVDANDIELVQSLHAAVYHVAFRRWIHGTALPQDYDSLIDAKVDLFVAGARTILSRRPAGAGRSSSRPRQR